VPPSAKSSAPALVALGQAVRDSRAAASLGRRVANPKTGLVSIAIFSVVMLAASRVVDGYMSFILATAALNVIVGVGLNILLGMSGQISFGHVGFFAIGAYAAGIVMLDGHGFWLGLLAAGFISAIAGGLLALPALRVSGPYLAMMTIAFAFIIEHGTIEWRGLTGGANGLMGFAPPEFFGYTLDAVDTATLSVALASVALLFFCLLVNSGWGLAMRAVRDSEIASQSSGLNPLVIKTVSFVLSAMLTGIAGALFASLNSFISPGSFPFFQSILFIFAVVIGGSGTLFGPVVGAAIVVFLPEMLSGLAEYRLLMFGGLLLGVLLLAPRGVVGTIARLVSREDPRTAKASGRSMAEILGLSEVSNRPLEVNGLGKAFGGVQAAEDVTFTAAPGRITSIIGPNGAGKTTVLNLVGGFYRPDSGSIRLGAEIAGQPAYRIARAGISRTYQTTHLFGDMSVRDNILIALRGGRLGWLLSPVAAEEARQQVEDLLAFVGYAGPLDRRAGDLPHVDKRLVEIARALATRPSLLLLDEPAAGLSREDKVDLATLLRQIADAGITLLLVEHDMSLVMDISDHIVVLDAGRLLTAGLPAAIRDDPDVHRAYLGGTEFEGRPRATPWQGEQVAVLTTVRLTAGYGAAPALQNVDVTVNPGEMVAVLGANGAGKSTLLRAISGLHRPVEGSVLLDNEEVGHRAAHDIVAAGLSLVPEGRQVFPELTARDNILLGAFRLGREIPADELDRLLDRFPRLRDRMDSRAGVLSGGEQQMLAIARGLVSHPKIVLLDEPSLGLAPSMIAELYELLADLRDDGATILIVDQMANLTLAIADRGYVLGNGNIVHVGSAQALSTDSAVQRAYLGQAEP